MTGHDLAGEGGGCRPGAAHHPPLPPLSPRAGGEHRSEQSAGANKQDSTRTISQSLFCDPVLEHAVQYEAGAQWHVLYGEAVLGAGGDGPGDLRRGLRGVLHLLHQVRGHHPGEQHLPHHRPHHQPLQVSEQRFNTGSDGWCAGTRCASVTPWSPRSG